MESKAQLVRLYAVMGRDNQPHWVITDTDMKNESNWTQVSTQTVTFDIPSMKSVTPMVVQGLQEKQREMRAVSAAAITEIDNQIASLLSLENDNA